jgi:hypothetical protein
MESIGEETCFDHEGSTFKCHRCRDIKTVDMKVATTMPTQNDSLGQKEPKLLLPPPKCHYPSSGRFLAFLYNL